MNELVRDFNEYIAVDFASGSGEAKISPEIIGVVFTMIQVYGGVPIAAQRPYIAQTKALQIPVFKNYMRTNKTLYSDAPQYGVPVVLSDGTYAPHVVREVETLVSEFIKRVGI